MTANRKNKQSDLRLVSKETSLINWQFSVDKLFADTTDINLDKARELLSEAPLLAIRFATHRYLYLTGFVVGAQLSQAGVSGDLFLSKDNIAEIMDRYTDPPYDNKEYCFLTGLTKARCITKEKQVIITTAGDIYECEKDISIEDIVLELKQQSKEISTVLCTNNEIKDYREDKL